MNGVSSILMVSSIAAVSGVPRARRDERRNADSHSRGKNAEKLFASILNDRVKDDADAVDCRTTTYGRDSKLQNYLYQTKEYRY